MLYLNNDGRFLNYKSATIPLIKASFGLAGIISHTEWVRSTRGKTSAGYGRSLVYIKKGVDDKLYQHQDFSGMLICQGLLIAKLSLQAMRLKLKC